MSIIYTLPEIPEGKWVKNGDTWCRAKKYMVMSCGCNDPARLMILTDCCGEMTQSVRLYDEKIDSCGECENDALPNFRVIDVHGNVLFTSDTYNASKNFADARVGSRVQQEHEPGGVWNTVMIVHSIFT